LLVVYRADSTPGTFYTVPVSPRVGCLFLISAGYPLSFTLLVREVSGVPAALTSEASRVATLVGVIALCYNTYSTYCILVRRCHVGLSCRAV
jgi:hypothetical protein